MAYEDIDNQVVGKKVAQATLLASEMRDFANHLRSVALHEDTWENLTTITFMRINVFPSECSDTFLYYGEGVHGYLAWPHYETQCKKIDRVKVSTNILLLSDGCAADFIEQPLFHEYRVEVIQNINSICYNALSLTEFIQDKFVLPSSQLIRKLALGQCLSDGSLDACEQRALDELFSLADCGVTLENGFFGDGAWRRCKHKGEEARPDDDERESPLRKRERDSSGRFCRRDN